HGTLTETLGTRPAGRVMSAPPPPAGTLEPRDCPTDPPLGLSRPGVARAIGLRPPARRCPEPIRRRRATGRPRSTSRWPCRPAVVRALLAGPRAGRDTARGSPEAARPGCRAAA